MRTLILVIIIALSSFVSAETIFPTRAGVWWYGTRTVFVGHYEWPPEREPLTAWGANNTFTYAPDHRNLACNAAADTLTTSNLIYNWGGLPDGSEVKFITAGTPPAPLQSWREDKWRTYYIRDWGTGGNPKSFKISATAGGPPIDITNCGSGILGMSFAGYSSVVSLQAALGIRVVIDTTANTLQRENAQPHGYTTGMSVYVQSTGVLPAGLTNFDASRLNTYCVYAVDTMTFKLKQVGDCSATDPDIDFTDTGSGTFYVYRLATNLFIRAMSGAPAGTTLQWRRGNNILLPPTSDPNAGLGYGSFTEANITQATLILKVPAITAAREWTVTIQSSESSTAMVNSATNTFPLTTVAVIPVSKIGPSSYPAIPGLTSSVLTGYPHRNWENIMTSDHNGGGGEIGGSGTGVASYPRCANRSDSASPLAVNLPTAWGAKGTGSGTSTSVTISHTLGSSGLHYQCFRSGTPAYGKPVPITNISHGAGSTTLSYAKGSGASVTCYINLAATMTPAHLPSTYELSFTDLGSLQVWFYSDRNFFEIAQYTGDPTWANCGVFIANEWIDRLSSSQPSGYLTSPGTMFGAYGWTRDPKYRARIIRQIDAATNFRGAISDLLAREHAFRTENRMEAEQLTGITDHHLREFVDAALGMMYVNAASQPERTFNEPFITGLLMRVLVKWYLMTHDERVPFVIKTTLDKFWSDWYDPATDKQRYNAEPRGLRCWVNCTNDNPESNWVSPILNAYIVPAFAFYWRLTGDDMYRQRGDAIFSRMLNDSTDPYHGKTYSQIYYWTWDYVRWRKGQQRAY